jgi:hypothetical protein
VALLAWFGQGFGGALALCCHWVVGMICVPLLTWMIATWPLDGRTRRAWLALVCVFQAFPVMIAFQLIDLTSPYIGRIWAISLSLVVVGLVVKASIPNGPSNS